MHVDMTAQVLMHCTCILTRDAMLACVVVG